jgi:N-acetylmuramoyl-L-alanine amidase
MIALLGILACLGRSADSAARRQDTAGQAQIEEAPREESVDQGLFVEEPPTEAAPPIVEWPVIWDAERARLMALYLERHHGGPFTGDPDIDTRMTPKMVVLHWTGSNTARSAWNTFRAVRQKGQRDRSEPNAVNLVSHFVVDRDGTIYRLLPETRMGRHTIGHNHHAIGVENVGDRRRWPLTRAQLASNIALVRWLYARFPLTHVIGHYEYRHFEGTPLFRELIPSFRTGRADPGKPFMAAVRAGLADLPLQGAPPPPPRLKRARRGLSGSGQ